MDRERSRAPRRATNVQRVAHEISIEARTKRNGHDGGVVWLTGLSGAGKSTLAVGLERQLFELGYQVYVLDGDNIRHGLCADLGFSPEDRTENIRRIGEVARLFVDSGTLVLTAFISPYRADRAAARALMGGAFVEVHVDPGLAVAEARDPKGLYKRARAGEISNFTGVSAPYEDPESPELHVDTGTLSIEESTKVVLSWLEEQGIIPRP